MSITPTVRPTKNGVYRIKANTPGLYFELQSDDSVKFAPLNSSNTNQLWNIGSTVDATTYKITSFDGDKVLSFIFVFGAGARHRDPPDIFLKCEKGASTAWTIQSSDGSSAEISTPAFKDSVVDRDEATNKAKLNPRARPGNYQHYVFERKPTPPAAFQSRYFPLTAEEAAKVEYDIIILGSGFGGGVLAADLFETNHRVGPPRAKKILLVERGDLVFHTHCLNAARPIGDRTGRDQFNHSFYAKFKDDYSVTDRHDWGGGPVYGLGGKGTIWSLAAPRIHDQTLNKYFPEDIVNDLQNEYYQKAEKLLRLFLPKTKPEHQEYMDRLNLTAEGDLDVSWEWARIASEFRDEDNFDFAQGAFSPTDKLLEIAMSEQQDSEEARGEYEHFKILMGTEARKINWDTTDTKKPVSVVVKTAAGDEVILKLVQNKDPSKAGKVVVSAGCVHTAAILLRSGVDLTSNKKGGLHITDHTINFINRPYRYKNPEDRTRLGALKLQTTMNLLPKTSGGGNSQSVGVPNSGEKATDITLVNLYLDSSPFLYRGESTSGSNDLCAFVMIFVMRSALETANTITCPNTSDSEPVVTIQRSTFEKDLYNNKLQEMMDFSKKAMAETTRLFNVEFVEPDPTDPKTYFDHLLLGAGGHEMGSVPMPNRAVPGSGCLDTNLLLNGYKNVYVCDLSAFPFVPEANPSLTLTGLSLRLSKHLLPPNLSGTANKIAVVNHSGAKVQVAVSLHDAGGKMVVDQAVELDPGVRREFPASGSTEETVFVYKLDLADKSGTKYLAKPEWSVGLPGQVTTVL